MFHEVSYDAVWRWHNLFIPLDARRGINDETCGLDDSFPPDDLGSSLYTKFIVIIIYYYTCHIL